MEALETRKGGAVPAARKCPEEQRERANRFAFDLVDGSEMLGVNSACKRVGEQLGIVPDFLRNWVQQARIDAGSAPGLTSDERRDWRSWSGRTASCAGRPRSSRARRRSQPGKPTVDPPVWTDGYYECGKKQEALSAIVDTPFATKSRLIGLVQVADVFALIFQRHAESADDGHEETYAGEAGSCRCGSRYWLPASSAVLTGGRRSRRTTVPGGTARSRH